MLIAFKSIKMENTWGQKHLRSDENNHCYSYLVVFHQNYCPMYLSSKFYCSLLTKWKQCTVKSSCANDKIEWLQRGRSSYFWRKHEERNGYSASAALCWELCLNVCLCLHKWDGWLQKSTASTGSTVAAAAYRVPCIHCASFSPTSCLGSLCALRIISLRHRLGRAAFVVLYMYTVTLQVVFIHMNRTMKHVQHVSWPQPWCEMANYGYF